MLVYQIKVVYLQSKTKETTSKTQTTKQERDKTMMDWQIRISMWDCDTISGPEFSVVEEQIPFIPRIGETFFMSERCKNECELYAKECWNNKKCKDCGKPKDY